MKLPKRLLSLVLALTMVVGFIPTVSFADVDASSSDIHKIVLKSTKNSDGTYASTAKCDGKSVNEYDYTWHADPSTANDAVKNSPAEYFTGTEPEDDDVYIAHDVYYYPELPTDGFKKVNYDGEQEWAYYYTAEGYTDYIFGTLPVKGSSVPQDMMHSEEEAYQNPVLHITEPGTYEIQGEWHGQIWIDLGDKDDTFADENAKVKVILNGVDVTCTVAPSIVFYSLYECDNAWENQSSWSANVDTTDAGANVVIADGSENNFSGQNVFRMLKTKYKDDSEQSNSGVKLQKKARKFDGAFYSCVSMNVEGEDSDSGILNINSSYEGLDSELHFTLNGGNVNIYSQDDGINVNEDKVSTVTVNGGNLHILAGLGNEGDGVDSNGYLVINGGTVVSMANPGADSGLDSDCGSYINGGKVVALGSTMDWAESDDTNDSGQVTMNMQFSESQSSDEAIIITDENKNVVFAYDPDKDEVAGKNIRSYRGAIISSPKLEEGKSYYVYVGGDVNGNETAGIYDISSITGFSSDAKQQCYSGNWENKNGRPGGMGNPPEMGTSSDMKMKPGNFANMPTPTNGGAPGDGNEPPEKPEGDFNPGQMPQGDFDPANMPEGFDPSKMPSGTDMGMLRNPDFSTTTNEPSSILFKMSDKVNNFSNVRDYTENVATNTDKEASADSDKKALFKDVASSNWFYDSVNYVYGKGLMNGTAADTFSPNDTTTRGMIVTVLYRLNNSINKTENSVTAADSGFTDVEKNAYYAEAVAWAAANKIVTGYNDTTFGPNDKITREQMAAIFYRYNTLLSGETKSASTMDLSIYSDYGKISSYAIEALKWCSENGIIKGKDNNLLDPAGQATRAEAATILMRFAEKTA